MSEEMNRFENENGYDDRTSEETENAVGAVSEAADETKETSAETNAAAPAEKAVPQADEYGWVRFDDRKPAAPEATEPEAAAPETAEPEAATQEAAEPETATIEAAEHEASEPEAAKHEAMGPQQSFGTPYGSTGYAPGAAYYQDCNAAAAEPPMHENKKISSKGSGMKAYVAAMTAAFVAVAVMLGLCIVKLNGKADRVEEKTGAPTVVVTDNSSTGKTASTSDNEGKTIETSLTVQKSGDDDESDLTALYEKTSKSCVSIICEVSVSSGYFGQTYKGQTLGSGFVIEKSGYIVTNQHVIEDATSITVQFYDGEQVTATLIGSDETCDLAVLKISTDRELYPVTFGDSDGVQVGQKVYAIGTPSNIKLAGSMTYGVISGIKRQISLTNDSGSVVKTMTLLQTDATINPGNSGGPLFNMNGEVIGINTLKLSQTYENIGFAIPSTGAVEVINDLIVNGEVSNGGGSYVVGNAKLGIEGATVNERSIQNYNLPENVPKGVYVATVSRKSAVYKEGLSAEDIITEFNGKEVTSIEQLKEMLAECKAGDTATLKYFRIDRRNEDKGEYFTITFKLDAQS